MLLTQALNDKLFEDSDNEGSPKSEQGLVTSKNSSTKKDLYNSQLFRDAQDPFK